MGIPSVAQSRSVAVDPVGDQETGGGHGADRAERGTLHAAWVSDGANDARP